MCHMLVALLLTCASPTTYVLDKQAFEPYWYLWYDAQARPMKREAPQSGLGVGSHLHTVSFGLQGSARIGLTASVAYGNSNTDGPWSEAALGYSVSIFTPELTISAGPALERSGPDLADKAYRGRVNLYFDHDYSSDGLPHFLYVQSDFGQGMGWFWADGAYFLTPKFGVGPLIQVPDLGVGMKGEFLLRGKLLSAWGSVLLPPNGKEIDSYLRYAIGGRLKFGN